MTCVPRADSREESIRAATTGSRRRRGLAPHLQAVVIDRATTSGFGATPAPRITLGDG
ncbi:MAG: hypothetical protein KC519_05675 [Anaerolineae bacterium]|nr:hypothetical protein [Anaerolineae bacterium]